MEHTHVYMHDPVCVIDLNPSSIPARITSANSSILAMYLRCIRVCFHSIASLLSCYRAHVNYIVRNCAGKANHVLIRERTDRVE